MIPRTQIDSRIELVTPENIAFQYRVAGPFRRAPAYLIDLLIRTAVIMIASLALAILAPGGGGIFMLANGLLLVLVFILECFYGGLFETYWNGQTPGKWAVGIRVVSIDGQPINALQAVMRNILRFADALPYAVFFVPSLARMDEIPLFQLGLFCAASNDRYQRLGDLACGTMVIFDEGTRQYGVTRVADPEALRLAELIPVDFQVSRDLARTLSIYVDRRAMFSLGRRWEIARHLAEPLRVRFNFPPQTSPDLLLCALYHRTFFAADDVGSSRPRRSGPSGPNRNVPAAAILPDHLAALQGQIS